MRIISIILFIAFLLPATIYSEFNSSHYNFELSIKPGSSYLKAKFALKYFNRLNDTDTLTFLLHKGLKITSLKSASMKSFSFDTTGRPFYLLLI